jgi:hypothetical protein
MAGKARRPAETTDAVATFLTRSVGVTVLLFDDAIGDMRHASRQCTSSACFCRRFG